jgi:hypothetical protein
MPSPGSSWVNPWGNNVPSQRPAGHYDYQTSFTLPTLPATLNIEGEFAADNSACLYANGSSIPTSCTTGGSHGFTHYTHFTIPKASLGTGNNHLDFVVNNQGGPTAVEVGFHCSTTLGTAFGVYDDGPINPAATAWTINFGYIVSDIFFTGPANHISGLCFGAWSQPGYVPITVDWSVTDSENAPCPTDDCLAFGMAPLSCNPYCISGASIGPANGYPPPTRTCGGGFNYDVYACTAPIDVQVPEGVELWVNLMNATTNPGGGPVFWDQDSGVGCGGPMCPSSASENTVGTIPPESFVIYGHP